MGNPTQRDLASLVGRTPSPPAWGPLWNSVFQGSHSSWLLVPQYPSIHLQGLLGPQPFAVTDFPVPLSSRPPRCPAPRSLPPRDQGMQWPRPCSLGPRTRSPQSWRPKWSPDALRFLAPSSSLEVQPPNQVLQLWGPVLSVSLSPAPRLCQLPIPVKPRPQRKGLRLEGAPGGGGCE